eukprot:3290689-Prymnesium_polylepis.1
MRRDSRGSSLRMRGRGRGFGRDQGEEEGDGGGGCGGHQAARAIYSRRQGTQEGEATGPVKPTGSNNWCAHRRSAM